MRRAPVGFLLLVALFTAACGGGGNGPSGSSASSSSAAVDVTASSGIAASSEVPTASAEPAATHASPKASPTARPKPTPTPSAEAPSQSASPAQSADVPSGSASPSASASSSPAASDAAAALPCEPEGNNANFWPGIARSVSWDVYCAVLPKGWSVASGSYRLAGGGKLVISYKGPSGATLTLSEGAFCPDDSGCVPAGNEVGQASFGSQDGTLVASNGGYSIVVDRGETPSWLMTTTGLDQATTTALGSVLARVGT